MRAKSIKVNHVSDAELERATGGNLEMHNCTTCLVALKEKNPVAE